MKAKLLVLLSSAFMASLMGCRAHQLQYDQDQFREKLMEMYTNQLMDNLIRCHDGLPFVQLDYTKITGTVTQNAEGSGGGSQNLEATRVAKFPGTAVQVVAHEVTRKLVNGLTFGGKAFQQNQLTVTADPVVNDPTIYRAYLEFLDTRQHRRLMVTCDCPPPGAALIIRQRGEQFYWVPTEYREDFRTLSLRTTAMRGEVISAPEYWETTVKGALAITPGDPIFNKQSEQIGQQIDMTIVIDPKIPNDEGKVLAVAVNGRIYDFAVSRINQVRPGDKTDKLILNYIHDFRPDNMITPEDIGRGHRPIPPTELAKALTNQKVKVFLEHYRPPVSNTTDLLKSIDNEIRLFRLNTTQTLR